MSTISQLFPKTKTVYTLDSVDKLINTCCEEGYEINTCRDGSLGYGKIVLVAPDDKHWNFVIEEVYLNCWSSGHTIRRCRKISNQLWSEIEKYYDEMEG